MRWIIGSSLKFRYLVVAAAAAMMLYGAASTAVCALYLFARYWLPFDMFELRFNQFLAILALLATVVYVTVHRKRYPHL